MSPAAAQEVMDPKAPAPIEVELLLCCARLHPPEEIRSRTRALLKQTIDWNYLLALALRHKVMPLLYSQFNSAGTESVPVEFMERLRDYFYLNAARNHLLMEELCEVLRLFERSGIAAVPYKGPALAHSLYGDVAFRQFADLDIMLRREDVVRANGLLREERGYRQERALTSAQEEMLLAANCESVLVRERGNIYLEIQWGFVPPYFPVRLDMKGAWERLRPISIGETPTLAFSPEDLLLILCVNAGKDLWRRLNLICDVAEHMSAHPRLDWEMITSGAARAGARRMLNVTLLVAESLLNAPVPEHVIERIAADKKSVRIAREAERALFRGGIDERRIPRMLGPRQALDSIGDRARFHLRLALTPTLEDWTFVELPERFRFLYYVTRPVRLARKYLGRGRKPPGGNAMDAKKLASGRGEID